MRHAPVHASTPRRTPGPRPEGLGSLLVGPVEWLLDDNPLATLDLSPLGGIFATSRAVHVLAVLAAVSSMFTPDANRWFAARPAMIGATS